MLVAERFLSVDLLLREIRNTYYPVYDKDEMYRSFHVYNRIQFFVSMYNDTTSKKNYFINELE